MFVDFCKAFDSVNRNAMLHTLSNYDVLEEIINAIAVVYNNPSCFVQTPGGPTELFATTAGILQGKTLPPFFFVIVVDYVLRQSVDNINHYGLFIGLRSSRLSYKHLTDLENGDDLALVAEQIMSDQQLLVSLENAAAKVGHVLKAKRRNACLSIKTLATKQSFYETAR